MQIKGSITRAAYAALAIVLLAACSADGERSTGTSPGGGVSSKLPEEIGMLTTIAGGGKELREGGPATEAELCEPSDVTVDLDGNVYIANAGVHIHCPGGNTVSKVATNGIISTVAGTGAAGFSGDGGPATEAQLSAPTWLAVDQEGNLYIADVFNNRIRRVDTSGIITTVAGTGKSGYSGDGGPATAARLFAYASDFAGGMAFDAEDNLYVADGGAIRKIDTSGSITTVAGDGRRGLLGDGGPATEASVYAADVAVDPDGSIYLSDVSARVRKVDPEGIITTIAGTGVRGAGGEGLPAASVPLLEPWGLAVDEAGNLFLSEHRVGRIRMVDAAGIITTVAGTLEVRPLAEEGVATQISLQEPIGLSFDSGVLYIADTFHGLIRAVRVANP